MATLLKNRQRTIAATAVSPAAHQLKNL